MSNKIKEVASAILETAAPATTTKVSFKIKAPSFNTANTQKNGKLHFKASYDLTGVSRTILARNLLFIFPSSTGMKNGVIFFDAKDKDEAIKKVKEANRRAADLIATTGFKSSKSSSKKKTISSTPADRMKVERKDLETKYNKLDAFIGAEKFKSLDVEQRKLLRQQKTVMKTYLDILDKRMKLMEK